MNSLKKICKFFYNFLNQSHENSRTYSPKKSPNVQSTHNSPSNHNKHTTRNQTLIQKTTQKLKLFQSQSVNRHTLY